MNVLMVNTADTGGGAEKVAYQLLNHIDKYDINVDLLVGKKNSEDKNILQINRTVTDRIITKFINIYEGNKNNGYFSSKKIFRELIDSNKYDLVHYHNIHGAYFNINNVKYGSKLPQVWTLHDMWSFTGRCAYSFDCNKWMNGCGNCCSLNTYPKAKYDRTDKDYIKKRDIFQKSNIHIVTPSKWLENLVRKSFLKDLDIRTIYNGVDVNKFKNIDKKLVRDKYNLNDDKIYILFLSAYLNDERKGLRYLINALNMLDNSYKDKVGILIAGKNFDFQILNDRFEIHQFGYVSDEKKLNEVYALADIFITPSIADNFPCTILESMSSGTPVIAFNIGGISEQIDSECGWLIECGDTKGIYESIMEIITRKEVLSIKGKNSRKKVEENFSIDICLEKYKKLYNEIIRK